MKTKKVVVIGAGPAGLTAAYELASKPGFKVVVLEATDVMGGIARTVNCNGNLMDVGGHRFFTEIPEIEKWWQNMMPVMERERHSRILFDEKFYDYPVKLRFGTLKNMGLTTTLSVGGSFIKSRFYKRKIKSLEDYYINRFGKKMYRMFFEKYTENLWGRHPRDISPEYGMERVNDKISILGLIFGAFKKKEKDTFWYPELGPGQMWETVAEKVKELGGEIKTGAEVIGIKRDSSGKVTSVVYEKDGKKHIEKCDTLVSSMPLADLVGALDSVPKKYQKVANGLPYRDYVIVGVLVKKLKETLNDDWIYVHDRDVKMGRVQIYNNWSPALVKDAKKTVWLGLEYFCNEGDDLWMMADADFEKMAVEELRKIGLIDENEKILDYHVEHQKKAYPAYFDTYAQIDELKKYLGKTRNLYLVGRNGRHQYDNIDIAMKSAFDAVKQIREA